MEKKQTAIEWLITTLNDKIDYIPIEKWDMFREIIQQALEMEKKQSQSYAEFAIRCDRKNMKILIFEDYIKL